MCALYSFLWAHQVFVRFLETHARATAYLQRLYDLGDEDVVQWIAEGSNSWPRFKRAVKYVEKTWATVEAHAKLNNLTPDKYYERVLTKRFLSELDDRLLGIDTDPNFADNEEHTKETGAEA